LVKWDFTIVLNCPRGHYTKQQKRTSLRLCTEVNYLWDSIVNKEHVSFSEFLYTENPRWAVGKRCPNTQVSWVTPSAGRFYQIGGKKERAKSIFLCLGKKSTATV
jgi:hypothetical protein